MFKQFLLNFYKLRKSISREIRFLKSGDEIKLHPKIYKESIYFSKDAIIHGNKKGTSKIKGTLTIPKGRVVVFQHVTFYPNVKMNIEGKVILHHCHLKGQKADVLMKVNGGSVEAYHCKFSYAKKYAIELINKGTAIFEHCHFAHNIESHIYLNKSQAVISYCDFSKGKHALLINETSIVDLKKVNIHYHNDSQIVVNNSKLYDYHSVIHNGSTIGIVVKNNGETFLTKSTIQYSGSNQIEIENSYFTANHCLIKDGKLSGLRIINSEATLRCCHLSHHPISNIQSLNKSRLNIVKCEIFESEGFGVEATEQSILNFDETKIVSNKLAQVTMSDYSICSINRSTIKGGYHVGIFIENSDCTLVKSVVSENASSAFNVLNGQLFLIHCDVAYNFGNGIMALNHALIEVDCCKFYHNVLPHLACKMNVKISIQNSEFRDGKSLYLTKNCEVFTVQTKFFNSEQIQIEISDETSGYFDDCLIYNGKSKGISVSKNSNISLYNCQITNHEQTQLYINDSSVILKNCELYNGKQHGIFAQNRSEVFIQESYISNHEQSQLWIDNESLVELNNVQLTEGQQSDVYVQNQSAVYVAESVIRNEKFRFNLQAINHSKIELIKTYIENKFGDIFYSKNNSFIKFDY